MNQIQAFNFRGNEVRTVVGQDGDPWFVAKDVGEVLGFSRTSVALRHCKGGTEFVLPTAGGNQRMVIIPERDVYRLILRSRLPQAEAFEEWVVGTVLPTVRKTGGYIMGEEECESEDELFASAVVMANKTIEHYKARMKERYIKIEK